MSVRSSDRPLRAFQVVPTTPKRVVRRFDATKVAALAQGYLDGVPVDDLAVRFEIDPSTVEKHVRGRGFPRRYPMLCPAHIAKATQLYANGESLSKVALRYGIGKDALARALRKAGVSLRPRNGSVSG